MNRFFFFLLFFLVSNYSAAQLNGRCDIFGQIFVTENPQMAQFKVFIGDSEVFADAVIFEEENGLMADREGIWHFTENRGFANFFIFFTEKESEADFTIYYTDIPDYAGCNQ